MSESCSFVCVCVKINNNRTYLNLEDLVETLTAGTFCVNRWRNCNPWSVADWFLLTFSHSLMVSLADTIFLYKHVVWISVCHFGNRWPTGTQNFHVWAMGVNELSPAKYTHNINKSHQNSSIYDLIAYYDHDQPRSLTSFDLKKQTISSVFWMKTPIGCSICGRHVESVTVYLFPKWLVLFKF